VGTANNGPEPEEQASAWLRARCCTDHSAGVSARVENSSSAARFRETTTACRAGALGMSPPCRGRRGPETRAGSCAQGPRPARADRAKSRWAPPVTDGSGTLPRRNGAASSRSVAAETRAWHRGAAGAIYGSGGVSTDLPIGYRGIPCPAMIGRPFFAIRGPDQFRGHCPRG